MARVGCRDAGCWPCRLWSGDLGLIQGHCITHRLPEIGSKGTVCVDTEWWQTEMVPTFCRTGVWVDSSMVVFLDCGSLPSLHRVLPCSAIRNKTSLVDVDIGCL